MEESKVEEEVKERERERYDEITRKNKSTVKGTTTRGCINIHNRMGRGGKNRGKNRGKTEENRGASKKSVESVVDTRVETEERANGG